MRRDDTGPSGPEASRRWTRGTLRLAIAAVALAGVALVVVDNFVLIEVGVIVRRAEVRLGWALAAAVLVGFVLGVAFASTTPRGPRRSSADEPQLVAPAPPEEAHDRQVVGRHRVDAESD